ncbi:MAG: LysR family transcriptional regulator [Gluconacetobacter diazotrophicus]|nr:LysR family transcriptional regulator [Gluconacetobacter diazotrophicus]
MTDPFLADLGQIQVFSVVADAASFSVAATRLGLSQSSVSTQVRALEERVGQKLLQRTTRRVSVTPAGEAMQVYARAMLTLNDDIRRSFARPAPDGRVRLGLVEDVLGVCLSRVLRLFRRLYPRFEIDIVAERSPALRRMLDEERLDVIVARRPVGRTGGTLLARLPTIWVGDPEVVPAERDPIPLMMVHAPNTLRTIAVTGIGQAGRQWHLAMESSSITGLRAALEAGLGLTVASAGLLPDFARPIPDPSLLPALDDSEIVLDRATSAERPELDAFGTLVAESIREAARLPPPRPLF